MDSRDLLRLIGKNKDTKQFWRIFLGKDILNELIKHPELLSMQNIKCTKTAEEEKEFFVKCMFGISTETGFKFEKEEQTFDGFYEKLGQYVYIFFETEADCFTSRKYDRQSGKTNSSESFLDTLQMFDSRYA